MIDVFYKNMAFPEACRLQKRVYKKLFFENAILTATDKKAFKNDIDSIIWQYTLKPSTIQIQPYDDAEQEYHEIAILHVNARSKQRYKRIAEIMHRSIPYPLLIVFSYNEQIALSAARKRINRAARNKTVVETMVDTGWIALDKPTVWQTDFLADFRLPNFSYQNFFIFYRDMVKRIVALNTARYSGHYAVNNKSTTSADEQMAIIREIEALKSRQAKIRNKLKKEKNMGTQAALNVQFKQIETSIEQLKTQL